MAAKKQGEPKPKPGEPKSKPIAGRYMPCPGAFMGLHGPVALPILQGPVARWANCPVERCRCRLFFRGRGWRATEPGRTFAELRSLFPDIVKVELEA